MAVELVALDDFSLEHRILLLKSLGYSTKDGWVVDRDGGRYKDPCTGQPVSLDNMMIMPGSTVILDANDTSMNWYLANYAEALPE